jgi:ribonuclease H
VETECRVNIYITTSIRGPAKRNGGYGYVIEFIKKDGSPVTRSGVGYEERATENRLTLLALKDALKRLTKSCSVLVFTRCEYVFRAFQNGWILEWEKSAWTNSKGKKLNDWELWKEIKELSTIHKLSFESTEVKNPYEMWISENIKNALLLNKEEKSE